MSPQREVGRAEVLWLLGSLSGFYRLPFDASLVAQEFPPPYTVATFHAAARALGLKTGDARFDAATDWTRLPLPAVAFLRPVPAAPALENGNPFVVSLSNHGRREDDADSAQASNPPNPSPPIPFLILKASEQKLLYFRAGSQTPEILPTNDAENWLTDRALFLANVIDANVADSGGKDLRVHDESATEHACFQGSATDLKLQQIGLEGSADGPAHWFGGDANDELAGTAGTDHLYGMGGNVILEGGGDEDTQLAALPSLRNLSVAYLAHNQKEMQICLG